MVYFGNFNNEVVSLNLKTRRPSVAVLAPTTSVPLLLLGCNRRWESRAWRARQDRPLPECLNREGSLDVSNRARVESSPAIAGGRVYVGSNDGVFYVFDLATGAKAWEFTAGAALSASPAIAGGRVVIGSQNGKLYCFG